MCLISMLKEIPNRQVVNSGLEFSPKVRRYAKLLPHAIVGNT